MLKLGCNSVIFSQLDLYGALQHIAWAGFKGAELCHQQGWGMHVELNTKKSYIDEVKWTAKKHQVELWAIHAGFEGKTDAERIVLMTQVFDVASKLEIPVVSIRAFGKANDKEATKQEFKYLREINNRAESKGVRLSVKPHQGASVYNMASALQMVNEIDTPSLGVGFDPLHLTRGGDDPAEVVLKLGKKIAHAQFHDCPTPLTPEQLKKRKGPPSHDSPEQQTPGRSDINWLQILQNFKDIGYQGAMDVHIIGTATYPISRAMGRAAEARGYLHRCLQELK